MTLEIPMRVAVVSAPAMLDPVMLHPVSMVAEFATLTVMPMPPRHFPRVLSLDSLGRGR